MAADVDRPPRRAQPNELHRAAPMKISVCIPNFNYGRYLRAAIESVLGQSHQDFEIVIADNASTDDSVEVVESFRDPRIRLRRNRTNVGFAPNVDRTTEM